jgi:hypothetical protein
MACDVRSGVALVLLTLCTACGSPTPFTPRRDGLGQEYLDDHFDEDFVLRRSNCEGGGRYKLGVAWAPGNDAAITMLVLKVHGSEASEQAVIWREETVYDSPEMRPISFPDREGVFTVEWAISPDVEIERVLIAVVDCRCRTAALVAASKSLARGELWRSPSEQEVTIHAPERPRRCW